MTDWQFVYIAAQAVTIAALFRIGSQAFDLLVRTRRLDNHRRARLLLWVFIAIAVAFLAKDVFWTVVIFWRRSLPDFLADPLVLSVILAIIQIGASGIFTLLWDRVTSGD